MHLSPRLPERGTVPGLILHIVPSCPGETSLGRRAAKGTSLGYPLFPLLGMRDGSWGGPGSTPHPLPCGQGEDLHRRHGGGASVGLDPQHGLSRPNLGSPEILPRVPFGLLQAYSSYWKSILPVRGTPKAPLRCTGSPAGVSAGRGASQHQPLLRQLGPAPRTVVPAWDGGDGGHTPLWTGNVPHVSLGRHGAPAQAGGLLGGHCFTWGRSLLAVPTGGGTLQPFTSSSAAGPPPTASRFSCQNEATADALETDPTIPLLVIWGRDMWLPKSQQRNQTRWQRVGSFHLLLISPTAAIKTDTSLTACNERQ